MRVAGRSVWVLAFTLLLIGLASPVDASYAMTLRAHLANQRSQAPPPQVQMHVDAGFGGNFRPAAWVPLRVRITNRGAQFTGVVRVDDSGQQASTGTTLTDH
ncbi:MAG TPA: hypothetical protein VHB98_09080, partial [Chloroflexota bacterium]|nr:hypothetical protein [Chloroflexota bacterium]